VIWSSEQSGGKNRNRTARGPPTRCPWAHALESFQRRADPDLIADYVLPNTATGR